MLTAHIPASPQAVFDAWMSSEGHAAMTGGAAAVDSSIGGRFTPWDGYIWGETLETEPGQRVVQSWRTNVPEHDRDYEGSGWEENYFGPMRECFSAGGG